MAGGGAGQAGEVVAAFQDRDHAPLGILVGQLEHEGREIAIVVVGQFQAAQGVAVPGVETGRNDQQFRLEWAEKCGIGFELSDLGLLFVPKVPNVPRKEDTAEAAKAA